MANLKQLKLKRQSIDKTRKVTRAMEAVSAVKMRKSQELALSGRPFAQTALKILKALLKDADNFTHPLLKTKENGKHGLLLITSDKGLAGALNSSVIKKAENFINTHGVENVVAVAVGRRANEFLKARSVEVLHFQENKKDDVSLSDSRQIVDSILSAHESITKDWTVYYMNFVSTFEQKAIERQLLPLLASELESLVNDIAPQKGKYKSAESNSAESESKLVYTIESAAENILDEIIPELVNVFVHHALLESKASEHSARMVAMKSATDKAGELSHSLKLAFNKARQAAITREVSEITSGVEAMKDA